MAGGVITRNAIRRKIVVYKSKRAKEDNALFGKQILKVWLTAEKYWMKTRNARHGWTLSAPFSCNDCGYITYKS